MTKEEMIHAIENAKDIHMQQMLKIESEISGKEISDNPALGKMECACGIWFHSHEQVIKDILGMQFFERLDKQHEVWHQSYASIYKMFLEDEKKSLLAKLFDYGESKSMKMDRAKLYYSELQEETTELLKTADAAIRRVAALPESKFH